MDRYAEVAQGLSNALQDGARVYWVCPLVSESELIDLAAAEDRQCVAHHLRRQGGAGAWADEGGGQRRVMARFASGEISILVATTVIEVGVNVPEATVMVIEHAERFGLPNCISCAGASGAGLINQAACCSIAGHWAKRRKPV